MKIFDTKRLRVRKLTPKEYGILQAFPMDDWKQVVSDSQAYKQFGNAVTTTVFTAIAEEIAKSIYEAEESEERNMEAENKEIGMNPPTAEEIVDGPAAVAEETQVVAVEAGRKQNCDAVGYIYPETLASELTKGLVEVGLIASVNIHEVEKALAYNLGTNFYGEFIGEESETLRNWEAAADAVNDILSKYTPDGYMGKIIYPVLLPLKERLEAGERTPDLYNAIVEATR